MSKPGPRPKPSNVHYLHGNPSKKPEAALLNEFKPDVELPDCPRVLAKAAKAEYHRLGVELERYGLVSKLDRGVLAMMATEWARYEWAERRIAELNRDDEAGEAGLVDKTPNGFKQMSVYLIISRKAMELYLKLATEFGLTPSARTRVTPGNSTQLALPGIDDKPEAPTLAMFA